jgi:hypothetical protein
MLVASAGSTLRQRETIVGGMDGMDGMDRMDGLDGMDGMDAGKMESPRRKGTCGTPGSASAAACLAYLEDLDRGVGRCGLGGTSRCRWKQDQRREVPQAGDT